MWLRDKLVGLKDQNPKRKSIVREYAEALIIAFLLAMLIRTFVIEAFKIPTGSMIPTLMIKDRLIVSKFAYKFDEPERGDVIVFKYPVNPKRDFIKRLIAKGGERVEIRGGNIYVDGEMVMMDEIKNKYYYNRGPYGAEGMIVNVPENHYYVLGDNSNNSTDSRYWGFVPKENLVGKALLVFWPFNRVRLIH